MCYCLKAGPAQQVGDVSTHPIMMVMIIRADCASNSHSMQVLSNSPAHLNAPELYLNMLLQ